MNIEIVTRNVEQAEPIPHQDIQQKDSNHDER